MNLIANITSSSMPDNIARVCLIGSYTPLIWLDVSDAKTAIWSYYVHSDDLDKINTCRLEMKGRQDLQMEEGVRIIRLDKESSSIFGSDGPQEIDHEVLEFIQTPKRGVILNWKKCAVLPEGFTTPFPSKWRPIYKGMEIDSIPNISTVLKEFTVFKGVENLAILDEFIPKQSNYRDADYHLDIELHTELPVRYSKSATAVNKTVASWYFGDPEVTLTLIPSKDGKRLKVVDMSSVIEDELIKFKSGEESEDTPWWLEVYGGRVRLFVNSSLFDSPMDALNDLLGNYFSSITISVEKALEWMEKCATADNYTLGMKAVTEELSDLIKSTEAKLVQLYVGDALVGIVNGTEDYQLKYIHTLIGTHLASKWDELSLTATDVVRAYINSQGLYY